MREADRRHPYDVTILLSLVSIQREMGETRAALAYARKLAEVLPDDPRVKAMVTELSRGR